MATFTVGTYYKMWGTVDIEADTVKQANQYVKDNINDIEKPSVAEYVEGSFEVDEDLEVAENFNTDRIINEIVDYMIKEGTDKSSLGFYYFYGIDIMCQFHVNEQFLDDNIDLIMDELRKREEVLNIFFDDVFLINFVTD